MSTPETIRALISRSSASGGRSTALHPLGWLAGILTTGLIGAIAYKPPEWVLVTLAVFLGLTILVYLVTYIGFSIKNPDALRSEKFTLSKMALEKNLIGDSQFGLKEVSELESSNSISPVALEKQEKK